MFSLFNFSSIFPGGQLTPFAPMCGRPCHHRKTSKSYYVGCQRGTARAMLRCRRCRLTYPARGALGSKQRRANDGPLCTSGFQALRKILCESHCRHIKLDLRALTCAQSMRSRVYVTVGCQSVLLSVLSIDSSSGVRMVCC